MGIWAAPIIFSWPMRVRVWHAPLKLDRFGCEYFLPLIEETTHETESKQTSQRRANYPHFTTG
jgi:hypothetical protein